METIKLTELIKASENAGVLDTHNFIRRFVTIHPEIVIENDLKGILEYGE
jgi:hypothetical protein